MVARLGSVFVSLLRILSESLFEVQLFVSINVIGTFRGVRGTGVGDYVSLNRPYKVLIMGTEAPSPPPPYPPKGPYGMSKCRARELK